MNNILGCANRMVVEFGFRLVAEVAPPESAQPITPKPVPLAPVTKPKLKSYESKI